jgi:hypothetical protein
MNEVLEVVLNPLSEGKELGVEILYGKNRHCYVYIVKNNFLDTLENGDIVKCSSEDSDYFELNKLTNTVMFYYESGEPPYSIFSMPYSEFLAMLLLGGG